MLEFKSYFENRSSGGGSPRIQLAIALNGEGIPDGSAFGYTAPSFQRQGRFREDLFFRLDVIEIRIPPRSGSGGRISHPWPLISWGSALRATARRSTRSTTRPWSV
jgi:hypothetical protein